MSDERLTQIETKLAFAESTVSDLSDLVYAQQRQIEKLEAWCAALAERLRGQDAGDGAAGDGHEPPPHY